MPSRKTYGSKKAATTSTAAAKIFGNAVPVYSAPSLGVETTQIDDITERLGHYNIDDGAKQTPPIPESRSDPDERRDPLSFPVLKPLIKAYKKDAKIQLQIQDWNEVVPENCDIEKIAEASFSEVYRITTADATSIIKIIPLRCPHDPSSLEKEWTAEIKDVVPEIRIMNVLTVIPGFVTFKGAHVALGAQSEKFIKAWEAHYDLYDSQFEHPATYVDSSTFLVIELGDAGNVLEDVVVDTVDRVWDIFLGVVIALSRAEELNEFEHRDLHENNICILQHPVPTRRSKTSSVLFGHSGIETTIIDYGLSRARVNKKEVVFKDLEEDLELFHGTDGHPQFDAYRRMRNHLFTTFRTHKQSAWHNAASRNLNNNHTWEESIPYSNVLWLFYLLKYLTSMYKAAIREKQALLKKQIKNGKPSSKGPRHIDLQESSDVEDEKAFYTSIEKLRTRFNYQRKVENGAFMSAKDVLDFCLDEGWILLEQITEIDEEGSFFE